MQSAFVGMVGIDVIRVQGFGEFSQDFEILESTEVAVVHLFVFAACHASMMREMTPERKLRLR